jgi:hypothetical protein
VVFVDSFIDDLTYVRDVKVCMEGMICYIPGSICYGCEDLLLCSLHDCYVGLALSATSTIPMYILTLAANLRPK